MATTTTKPATRTQDTLDAMIDTRRDRAAAAWALRDEVVLVGAGSSIGVPGGADLTYPFMAHTEYVWLTGHEVAGAVLAFDPRSGWTDFVPPVTQAERVWEGRQDSPGTPLPELAGSPRDEGARSSRSACRRRGWTATLHAPPCCASSSCTRAGRRTLTRSRCSGGRATRPPPASRR